MICSITYHHHAHAHYTLDCVPADETTSVATVEPSWPKGVYIHHASFDAAPPYPSPPVSLQDDAKFEDLPATCRFAITTHLCPLSSPSHLPFPMPLAVLCCACCVCCARCARCVTDGTHLLRCSPTGITITLSPAVLRALGNPQLGGNPVIFFSKFSCLRRFGLALSSLVRLP